MLGRVSLAVDRIPDDHRVEACNVTSLDSCLEGLATSRIGLEDCATSRIRLPIFASYSYDIPGTRSLNTIAVAVHPNIMIFDDDLQHPALPWRTGWRNIADHVTCLWRPIMWALIINPPRSLH